MDSAKKYGQVNNIKYMSKDLIIIYFILSIDYLVITYIWHLLLISAVSTTLPPSINGLQILSSSCHRFLKFKSIDQQGRFISADTIGFIVVTPVIFLSIGFTKSLALLTSLRLLFVSNSLYLSVVLSPPILWIAIILIFLTQWCDRTIVWEKLK